LVLAKDKVTQRTIFILFSVARYIARHYKVFMFCLPVN